MRSPENEHSRIHREVPSASRQVAAHQPRRRYRIGSGAALLIVGACVACSGPPDVVAVRTGTTAEATRPELLDVSGDLDLVDPSVIFDGLRYWIISTGAGMPVRVSTDLREFERLGDAALGLPVWAAEAVPAATHYWSPDVAQFGGRYHLYYALASTDPRQACIGHATASELGTSGAWTDDGSPLVCTQQDSDWFAIDPSVLVDDDQSAWLLTGSSGTGLKLWELDSSGKLADAQATIVAARPAGGTIQASAIARKADFYYVFSSFDFCCRGADSTRSIRVGRSRSRLGPYVDREGVALLDGGGTVLVEGGERWRGPGSNDVLIRAAESYSFYFAYDADDDGHTSLRLSTLTWDEDGWPLSAGP